MLNIAPVIFQVNNKPELDILLASMNTDELVLLQGKVNEKLAGVVEVVTYFVRFFHQMRLVDGSVVPFGVGVSYRYPMRYQSRIC
jgi:hypothetical protein